MTLSWTRSLFSRVFLYGLTVLLTSAATFAALGAVLLRPALDRQHRDVGSWIALQACSHLTTDAGRRESAPKLIASAYSANGKLMGSLSAPALPPLSAENVARLRVERAISVPGHGPIHAFWCEETPGGAYVELGPPPPPLTQGFLLPFLLVFPVVALASAPFARSIARPIAKLVRVTQEFGRGQLGTRTDIVRRDEVGKLGRAFNHMADRLQRLILAEQELLANVSHELRTPLARIRVVLETALENPPRAQNLLREIDRDLGDLERLVETVMETMRLDMGAAALSEGLQLVRLEPTDLSKAVEQAVERFRTLYPDRRVELAVERASLHADADPQLLRRLLDNLLDNARKYSDQTAPIYVRAARKTTAGDLVELEVTDRGVGIDTEDLPHVFLPFFRSHRTRSRAPEGAGLGLALAKKIVDIHSGDIELSSVPSVGTTVRVTFSQTPASRHGETEM